MYKYTFTSAEMSHLLAAFIEIAHFIGCNYVRNIHCACVHVCVCVRGHVYVYVFVHICTCLGQWRSQGWA